MFQILFDCHCNWVTPIPIASSLRGDLIKSRVLARSGMSLDQIRVGIKDWRKWRAEICVKTLVAIGIQVLFCRLSRKQLFVSGKVLGAALAYRYTENIAAEISFGLRPLSSEKNNSFWARLWYGMRFGNRKMSTRQYLNQVW